jgi:hypothetical protein
VDDLVAHVDRPFARREGTFDNLNGPDDARAKAARLRQDDFHAEFPVLPLRDCDPMWSRL